MTSGTEAMGGPGATGVFKFEGGVMDGEIRGWKGEWPPPDRIVVAMGRETGQTAMSAFDRVPPELWEQLRAGDFEVTNYALITASKLPDSVATDPRAAHVARMALYGYDGIHQW